MWICEGCTCLSQLSIDCIGFEAAPFIKAEDCQLASPDKWYEAQRKKYSCLYLKIYNPAHILIIYGVLLMMLPNQSQTYLGNNVVLKTFIIWLLLSGSFFLSFAFVSCLSWVPSQSWTSRSRLSSDSTLKTNTDTSTTTHKGRGDKCWRYTSGHWSLLAMVCRLPSVGCRLLRLRSPSCLPLLLNTSLVRGGRMALTTFKRHKRNLRK